MQILVDGVFFQLAQSGIARVWRSILTKMIDGTDVSVKILDRGGLPPTLDIERIPFPQHKFAYSAGESELIERMCGYLNADVFLSTYYTTPLSVPSVLIVHDMIPERFNFDMTMRAWQEKETAIYFARKIICVSNNTKKDLLHYHPSLPPDRVEVAYNGVDHAIFRPQNKQEIASLKARLTITRPYFLLVGSRSQHLGYKNARLFFNALSTFREADFDVLCVGGEPAFDDDMIANVPLSISVQRVDLSDEELALAYAGAEALVYPSLYEGFGMPVVEAMACGCPVITTGCGSLPEVTGGAAMIVDESSVADMRLALQKVRMQPLRSQLIDRGLLRAKAFDWSVLSEAVIAASRDVSSANRKGDYDAFFRSWRDIRSLQAEVDTASP